MVDLLIFSFVANPPTFCKSILIRNFEAFNHLSESTVVQTCKSEYAKPIRHIVVLSLRNRTPGHVRAMQRSGYVKPQTVSFTVS